MRFTQTTSLFEHSPQGTQAEVKVCVVVSDSYAQLMASDGVSDIDILNFDSVKQDLNLEAGSFAVDEFRFSVNEATIQNVVDRNCLNLLLEAGNPANKRLVAVFLGTGSGNPVSVQNLLFIGAVQAEQEATDLLWRGGEFSTAIEPLREYSFSALALGEAMFDTLHPYTDVFDTLSPETMTTDDGFGEMLPLYGKATLDQFDDLNGKIKFLWTAPSDEYRLWIETAVPFFGGGSPSLVQLRGKQVLVNLWRFLSMLLKRSEPVILAKWGIPVTVTLEETELPAKWSPTEILTPTEANKPFQVKELQGSASPVTIALQNNDTASAQALWIDFTMAFPHYAAAGAVIRFIPPDFLKFAAPKKHPYYTVSDEILPGAEYSFRQFGSISALLFAVARALGCYVRFSWDSATDLRVKFVPSASLLQPDNIYLRDASSAQIKATPSKTSNEAPKRAFNARTTPFTLDTFDTFTVGPSQMTIKRTLISREIESLTRGSYRDSELISSELRADRRAVLTTGAALVSSTAERDVMPSYPVNLAVTTVKSGEEYIVNSLLPLFAPHIFTDGGLVVNASLYVRVSTTDTAQYPEGFYCRPLGAGAIQDPANPAEILAFPSLTWYINYLSGRDTLFYESEYSIEVPYLNGFSLLPSGANPTWKLVALNHTLGAVIPLNDGLGVKEFVVVGVEFLPRELKTKLRLHSNSRFQPFLPPSNVPTSSTQKKVSSLDNNQSGAATETKKYKVFGKVQTGDAVVLLSPVFAFFGITDTVKRAEPDVDHFRLSRCIGIATTDADSNDTDPEKRYAYIQETGLADLGTMNLPQPLAVGQNLYVRKTDALQYTNVVNQALDKTPGNVPTATECMYQCVGRVETVTPPVIRISIEKSYVYNEFWNP